MERTDKGKPLSVQMKRHSQKEVKKKPLYDGDMEQVISTGSTLLDLEISGGRIHGGGVPSGILVEIFGPPGCGKTVVLCEIAGALQRLGGEVSFKDPEARLNKQFAKMFDLNTDNMDYTTPDTVTKVFSEIRNWKPENPKAINGIFTDSLAALSTDLEMDNEDGDKMGMRRAKEFSEELRKTCRELQSKNYLLVCSNQVRQKHNASKYENKYISPGGEAIGFYSSLRLRCSPPQKIKVERTISGKKLKKVVGVTTYIEVFKSSIWKPYGVAPLTILLDYGIDDIRQNLQFIKDYTTATTYMIGDDRLSGTMEEAIQLIEEHDLVNELKEEVINLWEKIQSEFSSNRKEKGRS